MHHALTLNTTWPELLVVFVLAVVTGWTLAEFSCRRRWRRAAALRGIVLRGRHHGGDRR